jgi:hypothetical protein
VWGERGGLLCGSFVGRCILCVGNVCGVRGWVVMGFICWKVYIVCR